MPLRDHFHGSAHGRSKWEAVHGQWPAMMVLQLYARLPPGYTAAPTVHAGARVAVDVAAYENVPRINGSAHQGGAGGGVAVAWAPTAPRLALDTDLPTLDEYEVRIYDDAAGQRLVAAVELVGPANKDRPEHRRAFVGKCVALLQQQVSVTIVDIVSDRAANLYAELLELVGHPDPAPPGPLYAAVCRTRERGVGGWRLETWAEPLAVGAALPTLPLWLADDLYVPLELEATYENTCRVLRIA